MRFSLAPRQSLWLAVPLLLGVSQACAEPSGPQAHEAALPASLYELTFTTIDGKSLAASSLRGKLVLFVNVASKCGFTPQYEGLQKLYKTYHARGLEIIGQPCNQFLGQEPGSNEEIKTFCSMTYGVTFPLLSKANVNGSQRSALYRFLVESEAGHSANISWNFEKFLVSPTGEVIARFSPKVTPQDPAVIKAIEAALPKAKAKVKAKR